MLGMVGARQLELAHLLTQVVMAGIGAGAVVYVTAHRRALDYWFTVGVSVAGLLFLSVVGGAVLGLFDPDRPGAAASVTTLTAFQCAAVGVLAVGVLLVRRTPGKGRCGAMRACGNPQACSACLQEALAQVCVSLPDGAIIAATPAFARLAGKSDLTGRSAWDLLDLPGSDERGAGYTDAEDLAAFFAGPPDGWSSARAVLHAADGTCLPVVVNTHRRPEDVSGQIVMMTVHDAAPLLAAECRLRDAQALQRGLAELSPMAVLMVGREGTIREANSAASHLLGLPRRSLVRRRLADVIERAAAGPVDTERFVERSWQEKGATLTVDLRRWGHRHQPAEFISRPFWELAEPMLLVFGRSVAYERRLERQLAARHRLSVLGKLADGMAHDVSNTLAMILARVQLLLQKPLWPDVRESLDLVERAAIDGGHIVHRALDLARGRGHRRAVAAADLNAVVVDATEMCRTRARQAGAPIRIETRLASQAFVLGEPSELRELLINLLLNAIEAMPHGGLLRVSTQRGADAVRLAVSDTGHGMDAAVRQRMFQPFFTTRGTRGSGLGLTLVRQIADRHKAALEVESEPGRGTTIVVSFPVTEGLRGGTGGLQPVSTLRHRLKTSGGTLRAGTPAAGRPQEPGRVLVVDDDQAIRAVASDILADAGHQVAALATGREALAACRRQAFDCAVIDLGLADTSGWELAVHLRAVDAAVSLVILSGQAPETGPSRGQGAFDFSLSKPFQLEHLLAVVSEAVDLARSRRAQAARVQPSAVK